MSDRISPERNWVGAIGWLLLVLACVALAWTRADFNKRLREWHRARSVAVIARSAPNPDAIEALQSRFRMFAGLTRLELESELHGKVQPDPTNPEKRASYTDPTGIVVQINFANGGRLNTWQIMPDNWKSSGTNYPTIPVFLERVEWGAMMFAWTALVVGLLLFLNILLQRLVAGGGDQDSFAHRARRLIICCKVLFIAGLLFGASSIFPHDEDSGRFSANALFGSGLLLLLPGILWLSASEVQMPKVVKTGDYLACGRCGYNLTGNSSGICPECGISLR